MRVHSISLVWPVAVYLGACMCPTTLACVRSVQGLLDKADPQNITLEALMKNDVMSVLCCPLAADPVPGVQSMSLSCLSKLAEAEPLLSQVVVTSGVLDSVVQSMSHDSSPVQAAANGVLSAVARSTTDNAHNMMNAGARDTHASASASPCLL